MKGGVEKGPFVLGSSVMISTLHSDRTPTGQIFATETTSDAGDFEVDLPASMFISLEGSGFYYDEITGALSSASLTMRSLGDLSSHTKLYINPITHLVRGRALGLVQAGMTVSAAETQAESELRAALAITPANFNPNASAVETTLLQGDDDASAYLFAVGAVLLEVSATQAGANGPLTPRFSSSSIRLLRSSPRTEP